MAAKIWTRLSRASLWKLTAINADNRFTLGLGLCVSELRGLDPVGTAPAQRGWLRGGVDAGSGCDGGVVAETFGAAVSTNSLGKISPPLPPPLPARLPGSGGNGISGGGALCADQLRRAGV